MVYTFILSESISKVTLITYFKNFLQISRVYDLRRQPLHLFDVTSEGVTTETGNPLSYTTRFKLVVYRYLSEHDKMQTLECDV